MSAIATAMMQATENSGIRGPHLGCFADGKVRGFAHAQAGTTLVEDDLVSIRREVLPIIDIKELGIVRVFNNVVTTLTDLKARDSCSDLCQSHASLAGSSVRFRM